MILAGIKINNPTNFMKTNKISLLLCLAILLHAQTQAQFLSYISTPKKSVASFQKMSVYENLICIGTVDQSIMMYEMDNSLYINDYPFLIFDKKVYDHEEVKGKVVDYTCYDKQKKEYVVTIYYTQGMSYLGSVTEKNTNMRFGLAAIKDDLTCK